MSDVRVWKGGTGRSDNMHLSPDGVIRKCTAKPGRCKYRKELIARISKPEFIDRVNRNEDMMLAWLHSNLEFLEPDHPAVLDMKRRRIPLTLPELGWIPGDDAINDFAANNGLSELDLMCMGVADLHHGHADSPIHDRLSILMRDTDGKPARIWCRSYDDTESKYTSSHIMWGADPRATILFNYGSAFDACRREHAVYLVEGQFDALATRLAGIGNVVSCNGSDNFYKNEYDALMRATGNGRIYLVLDADAAGQHGAKLIASRFPDADLSIVTMPTGMDPCDYRISNGDAGLRSLLTDNIQPMSEWLGEHKWNINRSEKIEPGKYKERRRWVNSLLLDPIPADKPRNLTMKERCEESKPFRLMAGLMAAAEREGRQSDLDAYRRMLPKKLRDPEALKECAEYGEKGSFDDLMANVRSTIWRHVYPSHRNH